MLNNEQIKSTIRTLIATFGGVFAGFIAGRGWFSAEQVLSVITSETFIGVAASLAALVWGLFVHTDKNAVAVVATIAEQPESAVKAIITTATPEGVAMAASIPSPAVVSAGTSDAREAAKKPAGE